MSRKIETSHILQISLARNNMWLRGSVVSGAQLVSGRPGFKPSRSLNFFRLLHSNFFHSNSTARIISFLLKGLGRHPLSNAVPQTVNP